MNTIDECILGDFFAQRPYAQRAGRIAESNDMTFCLGITVEQGLVAIADTRVVAGNECLVARKTASYQGPGFSFFVMNSGLRSLRDKILLYFEEAFAQRDAGARPALQGGEPVRAAGAPGGRRGWRRAAARGAELQRLFADRRADGRRFRAPPVPGLSGGELGGDRPRHAVPDHRRVGIRQADSGALAHTDRFHAVRLQGRAAGVRCHAAVRGRRGFSDGRDAVFEAAASSWWSSATSATTCARFPTGGRTACGAACRICRRNGSMPRSPG